MLDDAVQVADRALEHVGAGLVGDVQALAHRMDHDGDADQLLTDAVVQVEAEALALVVADVDLVAGETPEALFAPAELVERGLQRRLARFRSVTSTAVPRIAGAPSNSIATAVNSIQRVSPLFVRTR